MTSFSNLPSNNEELISYELHYSPNLALEQCTRPTGAFCGAMSLDLGFEEFVRNKVSTNDAFILTRAVLRGIRNYFQQHIKFSFDPNDPECPRDFFVPFLGAPDLPAIGLVSGYIEIKRSSPIGLNLTLEKK
jgi:hypothetical protein